LAANLRPITPSKCAGFYPKIKSYLQERFFVFIGIIFKSITKVNTEINNYWVSNISLMSNLKKAVFFWYQHRKNKESIDTSSNL
jgi:hypothetical protein